MAIPMAKMHGFYGNSHGKPWHRRAYKPYSCSIARENAWILRRQPYRRVQMYAKRSPKQPRTAQSRPEQTRAAQNSAEQPRAAQRAQNSPEQPRTGQSSPEQPRAKCTINIRRRTARPATAEPYRRSNVGKTRRKTYPQGKMHDKYQAPHCPASYRTAI